MSMHHLEILSLPLLKAATWLLPSYLFLLFAYRLLIHPLRHFPGSKIAAFTKWHWDYHASISGYLEKQHARYGPIIRIAPNEVWRGYKHVVDFANNLSKLHFSDPKVYHQIYHIGTTFTKDPHFYISFGQDESSFSLRDPKKAKIRKDVLSPLFSRRAINKLEHVIQEQIDTLLCQVVSYKDHPVDLYHAFRSVALDIISGYCFAQSFSTLKYPSFQHPILFSITEFPQLVWISHAFPFLMPTLFSLPESILLRLTPTIKGLFNLRHSLQAQIEKLLEDPSQLEKDEHETIYHHLMTPQPQKGQPTIPNKRSLLDEAEVMIIAGSDTVGNASTIGTYHVLKNQRVHTTLVKELDEAWPSKDEKVVHEVLEKLPYLTAVIKESLRVSYGLVSPMPRVVGPSSAEIGGVHVPRGTTVSVNCTILHDNPDVFPNPKEFKPERWLEPNSKELEKYLVPFSRGPRSCLGINLAWCELYLILGNVFRKLDLEIYDTSDADFQYKAYFVPAFTGKPFRAIVKERNT